MSRVTTVALTLLTLLISLWITHPVESGVKSDELSFQYTSQLYPVNAPSGCEAASLKMALSVLPKAPHPSLTTLLKEMPKAKTPTKGFFGNPYRPAPTGVDWTIYPQPLARFARRFAPHSQNITGASQARLMACIKHGHAVVFAGNWRMLPVGNYHVLTLVGYKPGAFLVADPYMKRSWPNKVYWVKMTEFMAVYTLRHRRAVVVQ